MLKFGENGEAEFVTVIGAAYFQPIADLYWQMVKRVPSPQPPELQSYPVANVPVSLIENGYAISICALSALIVESWIQQYPYLSSIPIGLRVGNSPRISASGAFAGLDPKNLLAKDIEELFVLRDALVHNHLWSVKIEGFLPGNSRAIVASKSSTGNRIAGGDSKLERVQCHGTPHTKRLGLELRPTFVRRKDAVICLKMVNMAIDFLTMRRGQLWPVASHIQVFWGSEERIWFQTFVNRAANDCGLEEYDSGLLHKQVVENYLAPRGNQ